ncbi:hypothetical protein Nepgr_002103 [Nepenthes gracilis]|uniref:Uncharacterized protein n=1 Tax=Nepenthes gracilis TaxID=150966 RepID=A0AAD3P988_NEPGR|nr:hypothetical protein Nepgr_002103 [Nepenthes gracilis]
MRAEFPIAVVGFMSQSTLLRRSSRGEQPRELGGTQPYKVVAIEDLTSASHLNSTVRTLVVAQRMACSAFLFKHSIVPADGLSHELVAVCRNQKKEEKQAPTHSNK